jgi:KDO2-lipid IV(A) lauroyltransferase
MATIDETRERLAYLAYSGGWSAVRFMPERAAYATFRAIADSEWLRSGRGVQRLEANLGRLLPPGRNPRMVSRAGMRSYLRYWCDAFRLPDWSPDRIRSMVRFVDRENVQRHIDAGRGVVSPLPHMANWDLAGAFVTLEGIPVTTVAERLRPEALYDRFLEFRQGLGMEILPLTGGDDLFGRLADRAREPRLVPLLADRDLTERGIEVTLAGERIKMPAGPAVLALRTRAALVPVTLWYEGREPHHTLALRFHPEIPVPRLGTGSEKVALMSQAVADVFTDALRAHPHDWHMLQRVFLADLDPRRAPTPTSPTSPTS